MEDRLLSERYRLVSRLGTGGMGEVWQAYDERLHRTVAVKRMRAPAGPGAEAATRLAVREGRIAAKLHHPHAITVYDVAEDADDRPYLVMEYLPSTTFADLLASSGPIAPAEAARVGAAVAAGLTAAHEAGVVHRDVKPGNVLLGADDQVKITDFGISRLAVDANGTVTTTGTVRGTPAYIAPEVARGDNATFASDVYSLGATLYTAVEGTPPFGRHDNPMALLYRVSTGEYTPPTRSGPLTPLLHRMLSPDPAARPTMADVHRELSHLPEPAPAEEEIPTAVVPALAPETDRLEPVPPAKRGRTLLFAAAIVLLIIASLATYAILDTDDTSNTAAPPPEAATSAEPTPVSTEPTTTPPPQTTTTQPPPQTTEAPAPPAQPPPAADPATALTAYYALMPGGTEQGWGLLTPRFQNTPAGGRDNYEHFWNGVRSVHISEVAPEGDTVVNATIDYQFTDGRSIRERHRYILVNQNGQWKIDQTAVLSSRHL
ncbi:protein kinase domain-containing protein [Actinokineospora enzanensis]|uniref:protein kinase domain-containing protein n=1 Tax=Actinokineospora enzanensis TaxID=155975 RepID=UPI00035DADD4|nr:protein kinase [Actinokineospora enzanensis]